MAPVPPCRPISFPGQAEFYDALMMQNLLYKVQVPFGHYQADVVLFAPDSSSAAPVILMLERPDQCFRNVPNR